MDNRNYKKNSRVLTNKEMEKFELTEKEKEEVKNINKGIFKSVSEKEFLEYKKLQEDFRRNKTKSILIRFPESDLKLIKQQAKQEGLPYQTLIKSILHKAVMH